MGPLRKKTWGSIRSIILSYWWKLSTVCLKIECILSAGPTVYSTVTPPPPQYTWTGCLCIQKMEVWRKRIFLKKILPPFFIGGPPYTPPPLPPPLPLAQIFFYSPFWPGFFCTPLFGQFGGVKEEEKEKKEEEEKKKSICWPTVPPLGTVGKKRD